MLRRRFPSTELACEPRHASWFAPEADAAWQKFRVARVGADPAPVAGASAPGGATGWRYWRMHGSPRMYFSQYGNAALARLAAQVAASPGTGKRWIVFDNTANGHAATDALLLQALLAPEAR